MFQTAWLRSGETHRVSKRNGSAHHPQGCCLKCWVFQRTLLQTPDQSTDQSHSGEPLSQIAEQVSPCTSLMSHPPPQKTMEPESHVRGSASAAPFWKRRMGLGQTPASRMWGPVCCPVQRPVRSTREKPLGHWVCRGKWPST